MLSFCIGMSADDRLYALRDPCKNRSEDKGDICKDSVGGNTCISVQLKDQEIEYDNNDSRGKLQYKRGNSQETNILMTAVFL